MPHRLQSARIRKSVYNLCHPAPRGGKGSLQWFMCMHARSIAAEHNARYYRPGAN